MLSDGGITLVVQLSRHVSQSNVPLRRRAQHRETWRTDSRRGRANVGLFWRMSAIAVFLWGSVQLSNFKGKANKFFFHKLRLGTMANRVTLLNRYR